MHYNVNLGRTGLLDINKIVDAGDIPNNNDVKPYGCLWGSRPDCEFGWEEWCKDEQPEWLSKEHAEVEMEDNARILRLDSEESLRHTFTQYASPKGYGYIDWGKVSEDYDVVEFRMDDYHALRRELYTIDCDCVAILNKNAIKEIRNPETVTLKDSVTEIVIPPGTTIIKDNEYSGYSDVKSVEIPEGVTTIGRKAFYQCYALEKVTLPSTLKTIETDAFDKCGELTELNLPDGMEYVDQCAFDFYIERLMYRGQNLLSADFVDKGMSMQEALESVKASLEAPEPAESQQKGTNKQTTASELIYKFQKHSTNSGLEQKPVFAPRSV